MTERTVSAASWTERVAPVPVGGVVILLGPWMPMGISGAVDVWIERSVV